MKYPSNRQNVHPNNNMGLESYHFIPLPPFCRNCRVLVHWIDRRYTLLPTFTFHSLMTLDTGRNFFCCPCRVLFGNRLDDVDPI